MPQDRLSALQREQNDGIPFIPRIQLPVLRHLQQRLGLILGKSHAEGQGDQPVPGGRLLPGKNLVHIGPAQQGAAHHLRLADALAGQQECQVLGEAAQVQVIPVALQIVLDVRGGLDFVFQFIGGLSFHIALLPVCMV